MKVSIRNYTSKDCPLLALLFYDTVHTINARDYSPEQLQAWAPGLPDLEQWDRSFLEHTAYVAEAEGIVAGFGDMDGTGYLDRLYVHKDYQGKGIATALCDRLESAVQGRIVTHASVTAKPFFEKRGYRTVKEQQVERRGILLTNYVMEKQFFDLSRKNT